MCRTSSEAHLEHSLVWIEICYNSNKMIQLHSQLRSRQSGSTIDSLISWSTGAAFTQSTPTPDLYLWLFLKDNVYDNNPQSIAELKMTINQKIRAIRKKRVSQGYWQFRSTSLSVSSAQWRSFSTHPTKNASLSQ